MNLAIEEGRLRLVLLEMERHLLPGWELDGVVDGYGKRYVVWLRSMVARVPARGADGRPRIVDLGHCMATIGQLPFRTSAESLWRDLCPGSFWDVEDDEC